MTVPGGRGGLAVKSVGLAFAFHPPDAGSIPVVARSLPHKSLVAYETRRNPWSPGIHSHTIYRVFKKKRYEIKHGIVAVILDEIKPKL